MIAAKDREVGEVVCDLSGEVEGVEVLDCKMWNGVWLGFDGRFSMLGGYERYFSLLSNGIVRGLQKFMQMSASIPVPFVSCLVTVPIIHLSKWLLDVSCIQPINYSRRRTMKK